MSGCRLTKFVEIIPTVRMQKPKTQIKWECLKTGGDNSSAVVISY